MFAILTLSANAAPSFEQEEMLNLINQARAQPQQCGNKHMPAAPPLSWHPLLEQAAQQHADDMASQNYFQHNSKNGKTPDQRIAELGYQWRVAAENIAAGNKSAQSAIQSWLKSPGHCRNLMNPEIREVGVAVATNNNSRYKIYWVMNSATPK